MYKKIYIMIYGNSIDRIFDSLIPKTVTTSSNNSTRLVTTESEYKVLIAVPGLKKDDVKISTKEGILTIQYERSSDLEFSFVESFKKYYTLPDDSDEKNITAKVENGILEIVLPKSKKKQIERLITVY
jgi:HSP20 family protein